MTIYYVYIYQDPNDSRPFYVGKGSNDRMYAHLKETKENTSNYLKWCKIQSIKNRGEEPIISVVYETTDEESAYNFEATLISKYGRKGLDENGILTNRCNDNRPPSYAASLPRSKEYLKNMSLAKQGSKNPMFGKPPWNLGITGYSTSKKGQKRKWITNGEISKQVLREDPVPEGWRRGRHHVAISL